MIESFLTTEFLSLVGGSITGFIFKSLAEKRQNEQDRFNRMMDANKATNDAHNQAIERVGSEAGKWVRRLIVLCILFGTILAPFILPFFGIPTIVEVIEKKNAPLDFFGLFGTNEVITFETVRGYLFTTENRQILVTIVGFYFGSAVGRTR
jgi:hypothetical protein